MNTAKITHVALFANNEGPIQSAGTSAEAAIAEALRDLGDLVTADDLVTKPVTPMMSALLASETPKSWVVLEDGTIDCEIHYAVFGGKGMIWNDDGEQERAFDNFYRSDIEVASAEDAVNAALDEAGFDRNGEYVVVSYPRSLSFGEVFEERSYTEWTLLAGIDQRLIDAVNAEAFEVDGEDDEYGDDVDEGTVEWAIKDGSWYDIYALRDSENEDKIVFDSMPRGLQPNWSDRFEELGCVRAHEIGRAMCESAPKKAVRRLLEAAISD